MSYNPNNPNGQALMADSAPVVIASDQSDVPVDTELPAAAALADGESSTPTVPRVGALMMGMDSNAADEIDRARLAKLFDLDSNGTSEYVLGVSLRTAGAGGSSEVATFTNPIYDRSNLINSAGTEIGTLANPVRIQGSDGTNSMPTMDAAARRGYQTITDGTNSMPTMDAAARRGYQQITDGTNSMPTMDSVARAGYQILSEPQIAKTVKVDPMRDLATVEPIRLVGTDFGGTTKDTNFWTEAVNGAGSAVSQAGEITLTTGAVTAGNYALYTSVRKARYVAGSANFFRGVVYLANINTTKNKRRWGAFTNTTTTPNNGCWFELDEATLYIAYASNGGAATRVAASSWNGTAFTLDTNVHTYEIWWTNSKIWYFIDDVLRHTVSASTAVWSYMGAFNVNLQNWNYDASDAGGTATMQVRVASIYRFGHLETSTTFKNITTTTTTVCKYGAGRLHSIVVNLPVNSTFEIYDNTSAAAPAIATITTSATVNDPIVLDYHLDFNTGLTIKTNGNYNLTVTYE